MRVLTFILTILFVYISNAQVRSLYPKQDEILTVRTALGIATIIQLTDVIQSAIIGDQSGFRVEYIDKAVTIKPLRYGVKTNLYLVTEKKRYNLRLMTLNQETADFIVYIKEPTVIETVKWKYLNQTIKNKSGSLNITRVGRSTKGFILIEARLIPSQDTAFLPKHIWIKQKDKPKVINGLYISHSIATKGKPIAIGISLAQSDLEIKKSITLELNQAQTLSVTISEANLWR